MTPTFTFAYKLAWLPRMLFAGLGTMSNISAAPMRHGLARPAGTKRIVFLGDLSAVANRRRPKFSRSFRELCGSADIIVANCESPIVSRSIMPLQTRLGLCHAMEAGFLRDVLEGAAIAPERLILSLANNHMADQGRAGLDETIAALRAMRITLAGVMSGQESGWECVDIGGLQIALLAFTEWVDRDAGLLQDMIRCGAPAGSGDRAPVDCDLACVLPHWGSEFRFRPDDNLRKLAAELAMLGGDVVAGAHPHVVQPLERVGATLVAYSLGDFLGSVLARSPWRLRLSMALAVDFMPGRPHGSRIVSHEAHPFFRVPFRGGERIEPIAALPQGERQRVERFAARVLGGDPPRALAAPIVAAPEQVA
jgi:hypothetical protein